MNVPCIAASLLCVLLSLGVLGADELSAQDVSKSPEAERDGKPGPNETEVAEPNQSESADEAEPVSASEQIQLFLKQGQPAKAAAALNEAMEVDSDDAAMRQLHRTVAIGFLRKRNYEEATNQLKRWFDLELPLTDSPEAAATLSSIVQLMSVYGARGSQADTVASVNDQAIARCRELESDHPEAVQLTLSQLIGRRVVALARDDETAALELLQPQIDKLAGINETDQATERTIAAELNLLQTSARLFASEETQQLAESKYQEAFENYPESDRLVGQFANYQYERISSLSRTNPDAAEQRMEMAVSALTPYAEDSRLIKSVLTRMKSVERRIESTRIQQALVGKPAPELEIDAWVNADDFGIEDLDGKVVLYDFWALWCGPCIATFPHLRELREEFGDQGFEIVGITRYYGYSWDSEKNIATRGSGTVEPEDEHEAVERFLQSKDMEHPTVFTPKNSKLHDAFGVTGIPHAALVDRQGKVQMIKVGSGQANADALHAKIEELIGE